MYVRILLKTAGLAAVAAALPALIAVAAHAQTPAPAAPPAAVKAAPVPTTEVRPAAKAAAPSTDAGIKDVAVGAAVVGTDGQKIGEVKGVKSDSAGAVEEIHVKTGSTLGFGGKVVVIPGNKIAKGGSTVLIAMTAADIGKLPPVADKKS